MKKLIILFIGCTLMSCKEEAQSSSKHGNFNVEFLFEKDGCKMYRFIDARTVYWCNCEGSITSDHTSGGKHPHQVYEETIITKK